MAGGSDTGATGFRSGLLARMEERNEIKREHESSRAEERKAEQGEAEQGEGRTVYWRQRWGQALVVVPSSRESC
mgnify:CR=1 FL=1